ncbi:unnamed protein product [Coregonus sp. 'balchen']|nr:unnamed protein product [Coregonus sp. 'balchen']
MSSREVEEKESAEGSTFLQMGASLDQQIVCMFKLMEEYDWRDFVVITSMLPGYETFVDYVRSYTDTSYFLWRLQDILSLEMSIGTSDVRAKRMLQQIDSQVLLAYCSYEEAQYLFQVAGEVGLLGPGYIWILPSLALGNTESPSPISFPIGVIGVITDQWRKSLRQRVREGVAIVAKGAESFKRHQGFVPEGHSDCNTPVTHINNNTLFSFLEPVSDDRHLTVATLEERPFVIVENVDPDTAPGGGIYSCFNGVEEPDLPNLANPDLTANYAQANMLKMLRTAKDLVNSAQVETSLDHATKTIEHWGRHGGSLPVHIPQQLTTETVPGGFAYVTENTHPPPERPLSPQYCTLGVVTSVNQQRGLARPTPLRYTLPARRLYVDPQHLSHPRSPFIPYSELQLPDIYLSSHPPSAVSHPPHTEPSRRKRRSKSLLSGESGGGGGQRRKRREGKTVCLAELRANHLQENHVSPHTPDSLYPGAVLCPGEEGCGGSWPLPLEELVLAGRRRFQRRPSFLRATWGSERIRQPDDTPPTSLDSQSHSALPDLFPCVMADQETPTKLYNPPPLRNNLFYPAASPRQHAYLHIRQDQRKGNSRKKLRHSHSTHLPTYREAVLGGQGGGGGVGLGVVRKATSLLSRQYNHYLTSYPGLPLYHGPLNLQAHSQASSNHPSPGAYRSPSPVCQLLACGGGCRDQRGLLYQDSLYGAYGAYRGAQDPGLEPQRGEGSVRLRSEDRPCVTRPWGKVSSLESEV